MPVRAYLYPFLAMLLWAGNVVVSKLAASSIAPTAITFYRLVLVLLVMTPFIILPLWRNRAALRRQWWQLAPLMTALLSVLLLGERLTLGMAAGGVLSFGGLLYLVGRGDVLALLQQGVHAGDALMLLACLVFALYGVLLRRWRLSIPAWQAIYCQALAALACMLPLFLLLPQTVQRPLFGRYRPGVSGTA